MTLDAMHWVWTQSHSKGNPRVALLAVADQVRSPACEVRLSYADFMASMNVAKSVVVAAIRTAVKLGELEIVEEKKGTRATLYRLPKAVGYRRSDDARVPDSGTPSVPESDTQAGPSGSDSDTQSPDQDHASGSESGTACTGIEPSSGPESGTHYPTQSPKQERASETPAADSHIPAFARPLVDGCTLAGVSVRWPFKGDQWFPIDALIKKSGTPALVDYARRTYERQGGNVDSARFFINGWRELPPLPEPGAARPPLRAVAGSSYQPYRNQDHSAYQNGF